jgi:U3 small nucleolar RNA-associated protein 11
LQDYKERSKAFHSKEDRIKALQRKAAGRNPDEFYFAMVKAKTNEVFLFRDCSNCFSSDALTLISLIAIRQKGVQVIDNEKKYTAAAMSKMKLEDQNYLQLKAVEESHQIQKLQANLQINQANKGSSKHTLFLDSQDQVKKFNAVEHFDTVPELVTRPHNRTRKETLATQKVQGPTDDVCLAYH